MTIHIPEFVIWMIVGAITIPLAIYLLWSAIGIFIVWLLWRRG